jgi:membrane protein insertase Oxa1/YidC/SpoIIIJ
VVYANPEYGFSMLALFGAAGLFVYWVSSNLIMVVQNLLIYGLPRSGKQAAP